jgi:hypothetical protein
MKIIDIFHYISHVKWIFFFWALFLLIRIFIHPGAYVLSDTGLVVFLMGLFLGFFGFNDIEKLSKNERKSFAKAESMKITSILLLAAAGYVFIQGIYFMNIKLVQPAMKEHIAIEFKTIGYHCFALGFGFLCYIKLLFDKYKYYLSLPEDKRD